LQHTSNRWHDFETQGSLDFSASAESGDRYRINIFRSQGDIHVAVRPLTSALKGIDSSAGGILSRIR
jgi:Tfp pilus assembly pilus retraction ATPase PilT